MEEKKVKSLIINCSIPQYLKISYQHDFAEEEICE